MKKSTRRQLQWYLKNEPNLVKQQQLYICSHVCLCGNECNGISIGSFAFKCNTKEKMSISITGQLLKLSNKLINEVIK